MLNIRIAGCDHLHCKLRVEHPPLRGSTLSRIAFQVVGIIVLTIAVVGCGPLLTLYAKSSIKCEEMTSADPKCGKPAVDEFSQLLANKFGLMALFAEVVYRRDLEEGLRDAGGCDYLNSSIIIDYGMPGAKNGRWERWRPNRFDKSDNTNAHSCFNDKGLYYETYVYKSHEGELREAVIAFRGTENRSGQFLKDWESNFAASFGFEPTQYRIVRAHIPEVVKRLKKANKGITIYAVGHSLGGGLAQQAGYLSKDIDEIFTFNTSPVTNWTSLWLDKSVQNEYPTIFRVFHTGEILEKIRFITTSLTVARFGRYDIGVQFEPKSVSGGKEHSMKIIACRFASLIAGRTNGDTSADHYFETDYVRGQLFGKTELCGELEHHLIASP